MRQHVVEAGDGAGEIGQQRRRAALGDPGRVMRPGNDVAALARRRAGRKDDGAGYRDWLAAGAS
ncbi:MAG: hypothetical protein ACXWJU_09670, partial [Hyphomicrobium sp.]